MRILVAFAVRCPWAPAVAPGDRRTCSGVPRRHRRRVPRSRHDPHGGGADHLHRHRPGSGGAGSAEVSGGLPVADDARAAAGPAAAHDVVEDPARHDAGAEYVRCGTDEGEPAGPDHGDRDIVGHRAAEDARGSRGPIPSPDTGSGRRNATPDPLL